MREFIQAVSGFTVSMSFLGLQLAADLLTPPERGQRKGPAAKRLEAVTNATAEQFGSTLRATFGAADNIQRGVTGLLFDMMWPFDRSRERPGRNEPQRNESPWHDAKTQHEAEIDSMYDRQQRAEAASPAASGQTVRTESRRGRKVVVTEITPTAPTKLHGRRS